jgi:hypothetical protein
MIEDQTKIPETETELTATEKFGQRFGFEFPITEITLINSILDLG